jgi:hypothetical protein
MERDGSKTAQQLEILIACYSVGGKTATQKLNHWTVAKIMEQSCSVEGVQKLAQEYPTVDLFLKASQQGIALLSSRLDVLDPSQVKPCFSKPLKEMTDQLAKIGSKAAKRLDGLRKFLQSAKEKVAQGVKLLKADMQAVLIRAREVAGCDDSDLLEVSSALMPALHALFAAYLSSLTPPNSASIPWGILEIPAEEPDPQPEALPVPSPPPPL